MLTVFFLFPKKDFARSLALMEVAFCPRFFYGMGYSEQQEPIFPDKANCFAPYFFDLKLNLQELRIPVN